jgi:hypothetical protein
MDSYNDVLYSYDYGMVWCILEWSKHDDASMVWADLFSYSIGLIYFS